MAAQGRGDHMGFHLSPKGDGSNRESEAIRGYCGRYYRIQADRNGIEYLPGAFGIHGAAANRGTPDRERRSRAGKHC